MSSTTNEMYSEENIEKYIKIVKEEVWVMAIVRRLLYESVPIMFVVYPDLSIFNPRLLKFISRDQNYKYISNEELLEQYHLGYKEFYDLFGDLSVSSMKTLNSIQKVIKDIIASEMCSDKIEFSLEDLKTCFYNNGYLCACANYEEENGILIEVWDKSNSNRKIGNRIMSLSNVEEKKKLKIPPSNKIQIKGSLQSIGYLFSELVDKGFIEVPKRNGNNNTSAIARSILEHFEFLDKPEQPKQEDIRQTLFLKNSLSNAKQDKFKIPHFKTINDD